MSDPHLAYLETELAAASAGIEDAERAVAEANLKLAALRARKEMAEKSLSFLRSRNGSEKKTPATGTKGTTGGRPPNAEMAERMRALLVIHDTRGPLTPAEYTAEMKKVRSDLEHHHVWGMLRKKGGPFVNVGDGRYGRRPLGADGQTSLDLGGDT